MKLIGIIRLGRTAEVRYTSEGQPVATLSGAWNYGKKTSTDRPTQWAELAFWGERAEKLSEWLTQGRELFVIADDVHVETYEKRDGGSGAKLVGRVESIEFTNGTKKDGAEAPQSSPAREQKQGGYRSSEPRRAPAPAPAARGGGGQPPTGFDAMDDDIPFVRLDVVGSEQPRSWARSRRGMYE